MRIGRWFVVSGIVLGGCFDEGGDEVRTESALSVADGLIAFADIKNNITTNPGAAGEALLLFIQTPVAAENLISPPTDFADLGTARIAPHAPVPDCLTTMGSEGCDSFATNTGAICEAGPFTFSGSASRTCAVCTDTMGSCTYGWDLKIGYVVPGMDLQITTKGPITTTLTSIDFDTSFTWSLTANGAQRTGNANIKSCGAATLGGGTPKRLVSSKFVVRSGAIPTRCAVVSFDGSGQASASNPTVSGCSAAPSGCP